MEEWTIIYSFQGTEDPQKRERKRMGCLNPVTPFNFLIHVESAFLHYAGWNEIKKARMVMHKEDSGVLKLF